MANTSEATHHNHTPMARDAALVCAFLLPRITLHELPDGCHRTVMDRYLSCSALSPLKLGGFSAVFVLFTLLSRFAEHDKPASMKQLAAGSHPELRTRYRRSRPPAAAARRSGSERACVPHSRPADH